MGLIISATGGSYKDSLAQMPAREAVAAKATEHTGFGAYKVKGTLAIDAVAGGGASIAGFGATAGQSETVIGIKDNQAFIGGHEVNSDGSLGAIVKTNFTEAGFFFAGNRNEVVERKELDGSTETTETTTTKVLIFSGESSKNLNTGVTTTTYNVDIGASVGIGLGISIGVKIPFYKKDN